LLLVPPQEWAYLDETSQCHGERQSPVNIQLSNVNRCNDNDAATVMRWDQEPGTEIRWEIKNTGRMGKLVALIMVTDF